MPDQIVHKAFFNYLKGRMSGVKGGVVTKRLIVINESPHTTSVNLTYLTYNSIVLQHLKTP